MPALLVRHGIVVFLATLGTGLCWDLAVGLGFSVRSSLRLALLAPMLLLVSRELQAADLWLHHTADVLKRSAKRLPAPLPEEEAHGDWPLWGLLLLALATAFTPLRSLLPAWWTGAHSALVFLWPTTLLMVLAAAVYSDLCWRYWFAVLGHRGDKRASPAYPGLVAAEGILVLLVSLLPFGLDRFLYLGITLLGTLAPNNNTKPVEFVITLEDTGDREHVTATVSNLGGRVDQETSTGEHVIASLAPSEAPLLLARLATRPDLVDDIELNSLVEVASHEERPDEACRNQPARGFRDQYSDSRESLDVIHLDQALRGTQARPTGLAVIDSGVRSKVDLALHGEPTWTESPHGTQVAGIAAALVNDLGIASPNLDNRVIVIDEPAIQKGARAQDVAEALEGAVDAGAHVVLMAFGARHSPPPEVVLEAVEYALEHDIVLVAAAGNHGEVDGRASQQWPANISGVLSVSSIESDGSRASYSNLNDVPLAVAAPGTVCAPTGVSYQEVSGTSMSAALVAGSIATLRGRCPQAKRDAILQHLLGGDDLAILDAATFLERCPAPEAR